MAHSAAYMKKYRKLRYDERMAIIRARLGGKCARCGRTDNLEIDHIDPKTKVFEVAVKSWCMSWKRLNVEIAKCQLLCEKCHSDKTIIDLGNKPAVGTHGTISSYRYCRYYLCKKANSDFSKEYRLKNGITKKQVPRTGLVHGTATAYSYHACRCDICKRGQRDRHKAWRNKAALG